MFLTYYRMLNGAVHYDTYGKAIIIVKTYSDRKNEFKNKKGNFGEILMQKLHAKKIMNCMTDSSDASRYQ